MQNGGLQARWPTVHFSAPKARVPSEGRLFVLYLLLSSLERFIVEFFRADHEVLAGGLSIFQYVCLALAVAALIFNRRLGKNGPSKINS